MKIVVIIPTHNEAGHIGELIDELGDEFKKIDKHQLSILVVDGNSSDGTADAVKEKMRIYKNLHLLEEKKKAGLGSAYVRGMKYAIEKLNADALIEFDGDGQHNPKDIKRLIAEFDNGYDYVIGSRYVPGGSVPKEWGWHRKSLSKYGSLFIRWALWLPTYDNTSGFKLSRVKGFSDKLPLEEWQLISKRHAYKIHFLYKMIKSKAITKEIPIQFGLRMGGDSKSSMEDMQESLRVIFLIRIRQLLGRQI